MDDQSTWGFCKTCEWWQIEPEAAIKNDTMGLCIDEDLQPFRLLVSGNSGCNHYMKIKRMLREPLVPPKRRRSPSRFDELIQSKRVYEPKEKSDGLRVLIMRLWPRGIKKSHIDVWLKELGT